MIVRTLRFHGNLIGTPTEYNLGLVVLLSTNQNYVNFVECTIIMSRTHKVTGYLVMYDRPQCMISKGTNE